MKYVVVLYPTKRAEQRITAPEQRLIISLCEKEMTVTAIKFVREQYDLGLYEAKQIVDTIREANTAHVYPAAF